MSKNYYAVLEVNKSASAEEIRKAYRKLAFIHHPDKLIGADEKTKEISKKKFEEIRRAYEVLGNADDREIYDTHGEEGLKPENRPREQQVPPIQMKLPVSLQDCYRGKTIDVSVPIEASCDSCQGKGTTDGKAQPVCKQCNGQGAVMVKRQIAPGMVQQMMQQCTKCSGNGVIVEEKNKCKNCLGKKMITKKNNFKVEVEPGMRTNQMIVCAEKGHQLPKRVAGDVQFILSEVADNSTSSDATMSRDEELVCDLEMSKTITVLDAILGFEFSFQHLDGRRVVCKSPADHIFADGDGMLLPGMGMPIWRKRDVYGDLIVRFSISMPAATEIPRLRSPPVASLLRQVFGSSESSSVINTISDTKDVKEDAKENVKEDVKEDVKEESKEEKEDEVIVGSFLDDETNQKRRKQKFIDLEENDQENDDRRQSGIPGTQCRQM